MLLSFSQPELTNFTLRFLQDFSIDQLISIKRQLPNLEIAGVSTLTSVKLLLFIKHCSRTVTPVLSLPFPQLVGVYSLSGHTFYYHDGSDRVELCTIAPWSNRTHHLQITLGPFNYVLPQNS